MTTTATLAVLAALAWALTIYQWQAMTCGMCSGMSVACPICMGTGEPLLVSLISFLAMWTAMMTAMMLPSITSMVVLFARVAGQRRAGKADRVPTWVFVCGYLTTWAILGFAAFAAARLVQWGLSVAPTLSRYNTEMAGLTLVVAGLYQLSPFKGNCLRHCRSPLDFILHSWRDGRWGALRMGSAHGLYCTGCCWGLMIVLFAVGLMNLAWMAALTVVMSVEKMSSHGLLIGRAAGLALLSLGVVLIVKSGVLPGLS